MEIQEAGKLNFVIDSKTITKEDVSYDSMKTEEESIDIFFKLLRRDFLRKRA